MDRVAKPAHTRAVFEVSTETRTARSSVLLVVVFVAAACSAGGAVGISARTVSPGGTSEPAPRPESSTTAEGRPPVERQNEEVAESGGGEGVGSGLGGGGRPVWCIGLSTDVRPPACAHSGLLPCADRHDVEVRLAQPAHPASNGAEAYRSDLARAIGGCVTLDEEPMRGAGATLTATIEGSTVCPSKVVLRGEVPSVLVRRCIHDTLLRRSLPELRHAGTWSLSIEIVAPKD